MSVGGGTSPAERYHSLLANLATRKIDGRSVIRFREIVSFKGEGGCRACDGWVGEGGLATQTHRMPTNTRPYTDYRRQE